MGDALPPPDPTAPLPGVARHVNRTQLTAIIWTGISVATVFVAFRLWARLKDVRKLLPDDYCRFNVTNASQMGGC
jgi:hypothetical protein